MPVLAAIVGLALIVITLWSAIVTVVVPRAERSLLSSMHFSVSRAVFDLAARMRRDPLDQDRVLARYAPVTLAALPVMWALHLVAGFGLLYWALDEGTLMESVVLSGSSLTTLGFRSADSNLALLLAIVEAGIGLGLVALLISYLPTMYGEYATREQAVAHLEIRAGRPPSVVTLIVRINDIGMLDSLGETWRDWEAWFIHIEETHTSHPALVSFRSGYAGRSWVTSAGTALDSAAVMLAAVDVPRQPGAATCLRAGFLALREIGQFFGLDVDEDPAPDDPISVTREEFDEVLDRLAAAAVPLLADRDQAWRDFAGWRVNYDRSLRSLCGFTKAPEALWSSDRAIESRLFPRLRRIVS